MLSDTAMDWGRLKVFFIGRILSLLYVEGKTKREVEFKYVEEERNNVWCFVLTK